MKTYSSTTRTRLQRRRNIVLAIVIVVCVYLFATPLQRLGVFLWQGPVYMFSAISDSVQKHTDIFVNKQLLFTENNILRHRLALVEQQLRTLQTQQMQTEVLNDLVTQSRINEGISTVSIASPHAIASVYARPPNTPFDMFGIDAGRTEGVSIGDKVAHKGIVIGTVTDVQETHSSVTLFSSPDKNTTVRIQNVDVEAQGQGGGRILAQVPKNVEVSAGNLVYLPFMSLDVVGIIQSVSSPEEDAFQTVFFGPDISLAEIQYVLLYKSL